MNTVDLNNLEKKIKLPMRCNEEYFKNFSNVLLHSMKKKSELSMNELSTEHKTKLLFNDSLSYQIPKNYFDNFYTILKRKITSMEYHTQKNVIAQAFVGKNKYYIGIAASVSIVVFLSVFYFTLNTSSDQFSYEKMYMYAPPLNKQQIQSSFTQLTTDELTETLEDEKYLSTSYIDNRFDEIENTLSEEQAEQLFKSHIKLLSNGIE